MPEDIVKTTGPTKASQPDKGGGATYKTPVFGIVKDNIDPTKAGRIKVFIGEPGAKDSDSDGGWLTVSYLSSYFGRVTPTAGQEGLGTYKENPSSYGQWQSPPDIGTKVLCIFVNGDPNFGFYIGGVPEPEALQMLPAIGSSDNVVTNEGEANSYGGATRLPVTNINTNDKKTADSTEFNEQARPVHSYTASIMSQQGILRDPIRGPISSSAAREAASRVGWGVSTPGRPIYEGGYDDESITKNLDQSKSQQLKVVARRGGHSIVMDDGDVIGRDQLIRIRTALGHQILMSDDGQTLMILHSNGQSYIELGKEGTVDIYSTNSINMRTQGDLNLHADQNVNIHASNALNIQGKTIHINSEETIKARAGTDINISALNNLTAGAGSTLAMAASGEASMAAGGAAYVNGSKVNLNSGACGTQPPAVPIIPINAQTDTLFDQAKGFLAAPAKLLSITSRAPAHAPWANAGQGVDVKTSLNASSELPPAPSTDVTKTNNAAADMAEKAPSPATVASVPATVPISNSVPSGTTTAVTAAAATTAATGPAAAAVKQGAAVVGNVAATVTKTASTIASTVNGAIADVQKVVGQAEAVVGSFAQTAKQLSDAGVVKPGAANMINAIASATGNIAQAMPASVFTGKSGAKSLTNFVQDVSAQTKAVVDVAKKAQNVLTQAGVMNGNEAPGAVAGIVTAATTVGVGETIDAVASVAGKVSSTAKSVAGLANNIVGGAAGAAVNEVAGKVTGAINTATNAVNTVNNIAGKVTGAADAINGAAGKATNALKAISSGNAAADLADKLSGLGGIKSALEQMGPNLTSLMDQAKGVAGSAYNAIKSKLKPLKAGVPQNLTKIAKEAAAEAGAISGALSDTVKTAKGAIDNITKAGGAIGDVTGKLSSLANTATGAVKSVTNAVNSVSDTVAGVTGEFNNIANKVGSISNSLSTTVGSVTSIANGISSTVGTATSVADGLTNLINDVSGAVNDVASTVEKNVTEINGMAGAAAALSSGQLTSLTSAAKQVQSGAGAAVSSQVASGISNFVGGVKTVANIVNNAAGARNTVPGATQLTGIIKETTTAVMNNVSSVTGTLTSLADNIDNVVGDVSGAINDVTGTINDVTGKINDVAGKLDKITGAADALNGKLKSLTDKAGGLSSLIKSGLPPGAAAELDSALSSLSAGFNNIKLPTIGFNTVDREEITSQIKSVLGDIKIPSPNLVGEIKQDVKDGLADTIGKIKEQKKKIDDKYKDWLKRNTEARDDLINKINTLPQGDPAIDAATEKLNALTKEGQGILAELKSNTEATTQATADLLAGTPGAALLNI